MKFVMLFLKSFAIVNRMNRYDKDKVGILEKLINNDHNTIFPRRRG